MQSLQPLFLIKAALPFVERLAADAVPPADARLNRPNTFIEREYIRHALDAMPASQRVILLDCCRNDPEAGRGGAATPRERPLPAT